MKKQPLQQNEPVFLNSLAYMPTSEISNEHEHAIIDIAWARILILILILIC